MLQKISKLAIKIISYTLQHLKKQIMQLFFRFSVLLSSFFTAWSCVPLDKPYVNSPEGQKLIRQNTISKQVPSIYRDTVYVPIYSDIYNESKDVKFNLTATLSIRNTSLTDSIYIQDIDYYDSEGNLVRGYIHKDSTLFLSAMQSIEYVIEENDTEGGTGANFIINWGGNTADLSPMFQGVMISTNGQQGISFSTEGVSISKNKKAPSYLE